MEETILLWWALVASSGQAFQTGVLLSFAKCNLRALDCLQRLKYTTQFVKEVGILPGGCFYIEGGGVGYREIRKVRGKR